MEVEALESIYSDEFKSESSSPSSCPSIVLSVVRRTHGDCARCGQLLGGCTLSELTDEPLSYQVHIVPNQDGQNNHGACTAPTLDRKRAD